MYSKPLRKSTSAGFIDLAADRQEFIDQGQSQNLFFPADVSIAYLHACHFLAWKVGLKSLYYCRSDKLRKADKLGEKVERHRLEEPSTCVKFSRIPAALPVRDSDEIQFDEKP